MPTRNTRTEFLYGLRYSHFHVLKVHLCGSTNHRKLWNSRRHTNELYPWTVANNRINEEFLYNVSEGDSVNKRNFSRQHLPHVISTARTLPSLLVMRRQTWRCI